MSSLQRIDLGHPALLEFSGPDAVRFLNGQLTQDVRLIEGTRKALPSCITDAKGKLQFRVWLHARDEAILVEGPEGLAPEIEQRLCRYLVADDVEVSDLSGQWRLQHLTAPLRSAAEGVVVRDCQRFGDAGHDWWIPEGLEVPELGKWLLLEGPALEDFRIGRGIAAWGREITPGMLPPEAGLDGSDISYFKGCYIGQEVISRIKSAGKLNRSLAHLILSAAIPLNGLQLIDFDGNPAGEITSIAHAPERNQRHALGFIKRGATGVMLKSADGRRHPVTMRCR